MVALSYIFQIIKEVQNFYTAAIAGNGNSTIISMYHDTVRLSFYSKTNTVAGFTSGFNRCIPCVCLLQIECCGTSESLCSDNSKVQFYYVVFLAFY